MKVLIVGLGSMGKRRIRCLLNLGINDLYGFDKRQDRLKESLDKYKIKTIEDFDDFLEKTDLDALIISTSPESHMEYAYKSVSKKIPCFIEASVSDSNLIRDLSRKIKNKKLVVAPSCTMKYFKGPSQIKKLISEGIVGKPIYLDYRTGQYLPDWHPWENINDFYVSQRNTGGCREIVPFELTWLNSLFGQPKPINSIIKKTNNLNVDIDDYYHFSLNYPNDLIANITVEVISRPFALREFRLTGSNGQIVFSQDENKVRYSTKEKSEWIEVDLSYGEIEPGYINPEKPYINEIDDFLKAVNNSNQDYFPNTLEKDYEVLSILEEIEKISQIS